MHAHLFRGRCWWGVPCLHGNVRQLLILQLETSVKPWNCNRSRWPVCVCHRMPELYLIERRGTTVLERPRRQKTKAPAMLSYYLSILPIMGAELWTRLLRRASPLQTASFLSIFKLFREASELNGCLFELHSYRRFFHEGMWARFNVLGTLLGIIPYEFRTIR